MSPNAATDAVIPESKLVTFRRVSVTIEAGHLAPEDTTMPPPTVNIRVRRVQRIAKDYVSNSGSNNMDFVTDLLADVMHFCAAKRVPFSVANSRAHGHFTAERLEHGDGFVEVRTKLSPPTGTANDFMPLSADLAEADDDDLVAWLIWWHIIGVESQERDARARGDTLEAEHAAAIKRRLQCRIGIPLGAE